MAGPATTNFEKILTEGVLVALASAYVYLATFTYELGYCNHFGIPREFINLSLPNVLVATVAIGAFFLTAMYFLGLSVPLIRAGTNPTESQKPYQGLFFLNGLCLIFVILVWHAYASWKLVLVVVVIAVFFNVLYYGIELLFLRKKPLRERFEAMNQTERDPLNMWSLLMDLVGHNRVLVLLIAVVPIGSAYFIGNGNVYRQERFFVLKDSPEFVLLRTYGDLMITGRINRANETAGEDLLVLRMSSKDRFELQAEQLGPLKNPVDVARRAKREIAAQARKDSPPKASETGSKPGQTSARKAPDKAK